MSEDQPLRCDVSGCDGLAIARALPTHGETDHEALRCRDCLEYDLDRKRFAEWREAIEGERENYISPTGEREMFRCDGCGELTPEDDLTDRREGDVQYCGHCDAVRRHFAIPAGNHEQYRLQRLADEIAAERAGIDTGDADA